MSPLYLLPLLAAIAAAGHFTNEWAVKISGDEAEAERVAKELNCVVIGECVRLKLKFKLFKNPCRTRDWIGKLSRHLLERSLIPFFH